MVVRRWAGSVLAACSVACPPCRPHGLALQFRTGVRAIPDNLRQFCSLCSLTVIHITVIPVDHRSAHTNKSVKEVTCTRQLNQEWRESGHRRRSTRP